MRHLQRWELITDMSFNPRTRKGCDMTLTDNARSLAGFNPRTRKGCD